MSFVNDPKHSTTFDNTNISNVALWDDSEAHWTDSFALWDGNRTVHTNQPRSATPTYTPATKH